MTKKSYCVFLVLVSVMSLYGQERSASQTPEEIRVQKDMPTVYITFERVGKINPLRKGESNNRVWLKLHNNTHWPLRFEMSGVPKEYGDAALFYEVLKKGNVVSDKNCHVCSSNQVEPTGSLMFSVPIENLAKDRAIRIKFSYGWEPSGDVFAGREPQHFVYFYSSKIPETQKTTKP